MSSREEDDDPFDGALEATNAITTQIESALGTEGCVMNVGESDVLELGVGKKRLIVMIAGRHGNTITCIREQLPYPYDVTTGTDGVVTERTKVGQLWSVPHDKLLPSNQIDDKFGSQQLPRGDLYDPTATQFRVRRGPIGEIRVGAATTWNTSTDMESNQNLSIIQGVCTESIAYSLLKIGNEQDLSALLKNDPNSLADQDTKRSRASGCLAVTSYVNDATSDDTSVEFGSTKEIEREFNSMTVKEGRSTYSKGNTKYSNRAVSTVSDDTEYCINAFAMQTSNMHLADSSMAAPTVNAQNYPTVLGQAAGSMNSALTLAQVKPVMEVALSMADVPHATDLLDANAPSVLPPGTDWNKEGWASMLPKVHGKNQQWPHRGGVYLTTDVSSIRKNGLNQALVIQPMSKFTIEIVQGWTYNTAHESLMGNQISTIGSRGVGKNRKYNSEFGQDPSLIATYDTTIAKKQMQMLSRGLINPSVLSAAGGLSDPTPQYAVDVMTDGSILELDDEGKNCANRFYVPKTARWLLGESSTSDEKAGDSEFVTPSVAIHVTAGIDTALMSLNYDSGSRVGKADVRSTYDVSQWIEKTQVTYDANLVTIPIKRLMVNKGVNSRDPLYKTTAGFYHLELPTLEMQTICSPSPINAIKVSIASGGVTGTTIGIVPGASVPPHGQGLTGQNSMAEGFDRVNLIGGTDTSGSAFGRKPPEYVGSGNDRDTVTTLGQTLDSVVGKTTLVYSNDLKGMGAGESVSDYTDTLTTNNDGLSYVNFHHVAYVNTTASAPKKMAFVLLEIADAGAGGNLTEFSPGELVLGGHDNYTAVNSFSAMSRMGEGTDLSGNKRNRGGDTTTVGGRSTITWGTDEYASCPQLITDPHIGSIRIGLGTDFVEGYDVVDGKKTSNLSGKTRFGVIDFTSTTSNDVTVTKGVWSDAILADTLERTKKLKLGLTQVIHPDNIASSIGPGESDSTLNRPIVLQGTSTSTVFGMDNAYINGKKVDYFMLAGTTGVHRHRGELRVVVTSKQLKVRLSQQYFKSEQAYEEFFSSATTAAGTVGVDRKFGEWNTNNPLFPEPEAVDADGKGGGSAVLRFKDGALGGTKSFDGTFIGPSSTGSSEQSVISDIEEYYKGMICNDLTEEIEDYENAITTAGNQNHAVLIGTMRPKDRYLNVTYQVDVDVQMQVATIKGGKNMLIWESLSAVRSGVGSTATSYGKFEVMGLNLNAFHVKEKGSDGTVNSLTSFQDPKKSGGVGSSESLFRIRTQSIVPTPEEAAAGSITDDWTGGAQSMIPEGLEDATNTSGSCVSVLAHAPAMLIFDSTIVGSGTTSASSQKHLGMPYTVVTTSHVNAVTTADYQRLFVDTNHVGFAMCRRKVAFTTSAAGVNTFTNEWDVDTAVFTAPSAILFPYQIGTLVTSKSLGIGLSNRKVMRDYLLQGTGAASDMYVAAGRGHRSMGLIAATPLTGTLLPDENGISIAQVDYAVDAVWDGMYIMQEVGTRLRNLLLGKKKYICNGISKYAEQSQGLKWSGKSSDYQAGHGESPASMKDVSDLALNATLWSDNSASTGTGTAEQFSTINPIDNMVTVKIKNKDPPVIKDAVLPFCVISNLPKDWKFKSVSAVVSKYHESTRGSKYDGKFIDSEGIARKEEYSVFKTKQVGYALSYGKDARTTSSRLLSKLRKNSRAYSRGGVVGGVAGKKKKKTDDDDEEIEGKAGFWSSLGHGLEHAAGAIGRVAVRGAMDVGDTVAPEASGLINAVGDSVLNATKSTGSQPHPSVQQHVRGALNGHQSAASQIAMHQSYISHARIGSNYQGMGAVTQGHRQNARHSMNNYMTGYGQRQYGGRRDDYDGPRNEVSESYMQNDYNMNPGGNQNGGGHYGGYSQGQDAGGGGYQGGQEYGGGYDNQMEQGGMVDSSSDW